MELYIITSVYLFLSATVKGDGDIITSNWKYTTAGPIGVEQILTYQVNFSAKCAAYCDKTQSCDIFTFDKTQNVCNGYTYSPASATTLMSFYRQNGAELYSFQSHLFDSCATGGYNGPTLSSCIVIYNTASWSTDISNLNVVSGIQQWTVPQTGNFRISAYGAAGGTGDNGRHAPGKGARIEGTFYLLKGTVLNIVCGQTGTNANKYFAGGGGGGTFVYTGSIAGSGLLIAAGGGGGGSGWNNGEPTKGYDGQSGQKALCGGQLVGSNVSSSGGIGFGGVGSQDALSGSGWYSESEDTFNVLDDGNSAQHWRGGIGAHDGDGGFGGGNVGLEDSGGGGGGGYTGGDASLSTFGGCGAGSYNGGINQSNFSGNNAGHGHVYVAVML